MSTTGLPPALVLGLGANGYGIVRSLAREGVPVVGLYSRADEFGRLSRHLESRRVPADALRDGEAFCETLAGQARTLGERPVVFPTDDRHALLLSQHHAALAPHVRSHAVPVWTMSALVDKAEMSRRCAALGVRVPRTHVTEPGEDVRLAARGFRFPCIVKPSQSFGAGFPPGLKNFVAESPETLEAFYSAHPTLAGASIWQEIVPGDDDTIFQCTVVVRESGEVGGVSSIRKIHQYPPGFGITSLGRTEDNPAVVRESLRLLEALAYRGVASLEFKRHAGTDYFIELNPRLPWYNALFADAGVNLPYLAYRDLIGQPLPAPAQRDAVHWVSLAEDLGWLLRSRDGKRVSVLAWLSGVLCARSYAWWSWRDPLPALRAALRLLARIVGRRRADEAPAPSRRAWVPVGTGTGGDRTGRADR
jgi:predicted ATP-grasp superfamily ATP-dependent carboligase